LYVGLFFCLVKLGQELDQECDGVAGAALVLLNGQNVNAVGECEQQVEVILILVLKKSCQQKRVYSCFGDWI